MRCCDLNSGMLRHRFNLQQLTNTPDGQGGFTRTWATVAVLRCHVKQLSGAEPMRSGGLKTVARYKLYTRYFAAALVTCRLVGEGLTLNIRRVDDLELKKRWLEIEAEIGVPDET